MPKLSIEKPVLRLLLPFAGAAVILLVSFYISLRFGAAATTSTDIFRAIFAEEQTEASLIIQEIRLPREIGAAVTGAALACAGAIMQGMTRNPLAEPGLLGLTSGATFALAVSLAFFPELNYIGIMFVCMIGAAVAAGIVFGINYTSRGPVSPFRIVLAGAAVSAFFAAAAEGLGLLVRISQDISMWTAGGLIGTNWTQLQIIVPVIAAALVLALFLARQLTLLSVNEDVAVGLGQRTEVVKAMLFLIVVLLAGTAVAIAGNLAFVGLMIPHLVRPFTGRDYRTVLPVSAVTGAAFLLLTDTAGRTINAPYETPVAALVAVLGLPFFLWVVRRKGGTPA
ncbi:FecCD family ABC transporter permease [Alkalicoccus urumqiensis]|uniref:Iron ABC transporter n=1 Tax=Alkalicoccus urumqiensis TaxID=1548213 RepID=A0A2P6MIL3_ALKUR|nr:iron ABC transporter permease [Alkalicoccus urumqiensis]PRO66073.1 iron ABC transporter [Alkalicoccus urumqiensis]